MKKGFEPHMASDPNAPLSEGEFQSLLALADGVDPAAIPAKDRGLLIRLGFVKRIGTELRVTAAGRLRAMRGR